MIEAFSPGSVTLFFEIVDDHRDLLRRGSRGVGICLSRGVTTRIIPGTELEIYINGERAQNTIQEEVAKEYGFTGRIESRVELPVSQGFGMSGAAALSTAYAIAAYMGETSLSAAHIAHVTEVRRRSGLGDVATQYEGGITVRKTAGIQPYGVVDRILVAPQELYLVIFDEKGVKTKSVLTDPDKRKLIKREGRRAMELFLRNPALENAIKLARIFSFNTGLLGEEARNFLEMCENAAVAMLGNSAVVFGNCRRDILEDYRVFRVETGPRAHVVSFSSYHSGKKNLSSRFD